MARRVKEAKLAAAVEALIHAQPPRVDAEGRRFLWYHQVQGLLGFHWLRGCLWVCGGLLTDGWALEEKGMTLCVDDSV